MLGRLQVGGLDARVFVNLENSSVPYSVSLLHYFINYLVAILHQSSLRNIIIIIVILSLFSFSYYPLAFLFSRCISTVPSTIQISCDFNSSVSLLSYLTLHY